MLQIGQCRYDPSVQMFVEQPREPTFAHLRFLRWLAERGRLEHEPVSPACGEYAARMRAASPFARAYPDRVEGRQVPDGPIPLPGRAQPTAQATG